MRKSILIVDDHPDSAETLGMMFEHFGFDVRTAEDGLAALEQLEVFLPDIILSDYSMPNLDGIQFWKKTRANPRTQHIPFILMSAIDRPEFSSVPVNALIQKPVGFERLLNEVNAALDLRNEQ